MNSTHLLAQAVEETTLEMVETQRKTAKPVAYVPFGDDEDGDAERIAKLGVGGSYRRIALTRRTIPRGPACRDGRDAT